MSNVLTTKATYTVYQTLCMARLVHYLQLLKTYGQDPDREGWLLAAVQKAVYAAYRDCVAAKVPQEARLLVESAQVAL
ncbi:MAG: hypothetical protein HY683_04630 [Chloroflexi bacterium]|nr:hypothetical protein [Chloroflexota bacterium]